MSLIDFASGESGIRTHGTLPSTPDFESGTFGRSVISPRPNLAAVLCPVNVAIRGFVTNSLVGRPSSENRPIYWAFRDYRSVHVRGSQSQHVQFEVHFRKYTLEPVTKRLQMGWSQAWREGSPLTASML